ncbi:MAG: hypothetical protein AAF226_09330 [Verrucomicrobiota bacterium]
MKTARHLLLGSSMVVAMSLVSCRTNQHASHNKTPEDARYGAEAGSSSYPDGEVARETGQAVNNAVNEAAESVSSAVNKYPGTDVDPTQAPATNQFGYRDSSGAIQNPVQPESRNNYKSLIPDPPSKPQIKVPEVKAPQVPAAPTRQYADKIPGDPLHVRLPGAGRSLGKVSIEQYSGNTPTGKPLPRGTASYITDPRTGQRIEFLVP